MYAVFFNIHRMNMKNRTIKYMAATFAVFALIGCEDKVNKDVTWPEWASRPLIEDASVTANGKTGIVAGESVKFSAKINDDYNELKSWSLTVKYGDNTVVSHEAALSGNDAEIEYEFVMPFAANLDDGGFYPEVSVSANNVAGGENSTRLSRDRNISVSRPAAPASLLLVDENGKQFPLVKTSDFVYSTASGTDLTALGTKVYVTEKVSGGKPDYSGYVWGMSDGKISVLRDNSEGDAITVPDTEGYGFSKFGFNIYSFKIDKLVGLTVHLDKDALESQTQSGVTYLSLEEVRLVQDCEVTFSGFGALDKMLQSDRFEILSDTSAKFTGHSANWSFYYDTDTGWMILNYAVFNTSDQLWVTGLKACFPLGNDSSEHELKYLDGDGKVRYATLAAVKDSEGDFHIRIYLKDEYAIQLYRWVKWSTLVEMTSMTPETAAISADGVYIRPGSNFKAGVYELRVHFTKEADSGGDGSKAEIYVTAL